MNLEIKKGIMEAVDKKREQKFEVADKIYSKLDKKYPDNADILKSWAKTIFCLGNYEKGIEVMYRASALFREANRYGESWQCNDQIKTIESRDINYDDFLDYMRSISGNRRFIPKK